MKTKPFARLTSAEIARRTRHPANKQRQALVYDTMKLTDLIFTRRRIYLIHRKSSTGWCEARCIWPQHGVTQDCRQFWLLELRRDPSDLAWLTEGDRHIAMPQTKEFITYPYWLCLFKLAWMELTKWSWKECGKNYDNADLKSAYYDEGCTPQDAVDEELSASV